MTILVISNAYETISKIGFYYDLGRAMLTLTSDTGLPSECSEVRERSLCQEASGGAGTPFEEKKKKK